MDKSSRLAQYGTIAEALKPFPTDAVENGIMRCCLDGTGPDGRNMDEQEDKVVSVLKAHGFRTDIESVVEFFEILLEKDNKEENGIVFTPKYISDYIVQNVFSDLDAWDDRITVIDPGCGCGIFLVSVIEFFNHKFHVPIKTLLEKTVLGADIVEANVRRCRLVMRILAERNGEHLDKTPRIRCMDSLKEDWKAAFQVDEIAYVVGNPPYVNPHDMKKETAKFLKEQFKTTQTGVFNIFYAFIETAMKNLEDNGRLGFIVPNNFLTIKSAAKLREYLQNQAVIEKILDFGENMIFKPVRTYNCILFLKKSRRDSFRYFVMGRTDDWKTEMASFDFQVMDTANLDKNGWKLVDGKTRRNLEKIENQDVSMKAFIRTGIATLKDSAYLVEYDGKDFYKCLDGETYYLEPELIKTIYKIPELKLCKSIYEARRYIIFPYLHTKEGYSLIPETQFQKEYPCTYGCLEKQKAELDKRDKGKENPLGWYAYGRTQGLNRYGRKLLFPTFAANPRFLYVDDEEALFCNGFAVFENDTFELPFLAKILNSCIMSYYISNTSYMIEGGYYCYQKKYIERFSVPLFSEAEKQVIEQASQQELDAFLIEKYGLEL